MELGFGFLFTNWHRLKLLIVHSTQQLYWQNWRKFEFTCCQHEVKNRSTAYKVI